MKISRNRAVREYGYLIVEVLESIANCLELLVGARKASEVSISSVSTAEECVFCKP